MLKIEKPGSPGFDTVVKNDHFKCAFITYSPCYAFGAVDHMKRHNNTDEIFVLLSDRAVLLIMDNDEIQKHEMEQGSAYNVGRATWHYLAVSGDARVFAAERSDTDGTNTDVIRFDVPYILSE